IPIKICCIDALMYAHVYTYIRILIGKIISLDLRAKPLPRLY
ncbi:hypothetical protein V1477_019257, partial [Vespula maculifrons]